MNGCTPTFSSNKLCLLGITLRKWRATVANPTVPLAHVLRLFTRSLKLPYRRDYALTRANVEDVWMPKKTFANRIYIYDFRFFNFIYRGSRAKLCYWIKVPSRVAALLKRIEFLQRVFLCEVLPLGMSSKLRRGYTGFESLLRAKVELEFISSRSYRWWYIVPLTFHRRLASSASWLHQRARADIDAYFTLNHLFQDIYARFTDHWSPSRGL